MLLGIALVSYTAYTSARGSLVTSIERQLVGLQRSKADIVRSILTSTKNEVLTLSGSDAIGVVARELTDACRQLSRGKEGLGLPPAGPRRERLLPLQVHWRWSSRPWCQWPGCRGEPCVPHPEPDDRAWQARVACDQSLTRRLPPLAMPRLDL